MLFFLLTVALPGARSEVEELVEIAYIKARYGEEIAEKVQIRKPDLGPGRTGVATQSAVKPVEPETPQAEPPKPVPERPEVPKPRPPQLEAQQALDDVVSPAATPPAMSAPAPPPVKKLSLKEKIPLAKLARPDARSPERSDLGDVDAVGVRSPDIPAVDVPRQRPTLQNRLAVPDAAVARPTDRTPASDAVEDVRGGTLTPSAPSRPGAIVPKGSLETRRGAPGGTGALDAAEPGGGATTSEAKKRRTILDYGDGNGGTGHGGALTGRARQPVEPKIVPGGGTSAKVDDEALADEAVSVGGNGLDMTITGPLSGRAINKAVPPLYPEIARKHGWEGAVAIHFTVLADGAVKDNMYVEQASAHHELDGAAMAALRQWIFSALPAHEAQVEQWGVLTIIFRLD